MSTVDEYLEANSERFEDELCQLLAIPSVSTDSQWNDDVRRAAEWMHSTFQKIGFTSEIHDTPGHPVVYAESPPVPDAPIALVYGHYDVQPPDPLDEWITPPFEPTRREGNVYARGATDDKGQMLTHVKSAEAWVSSGEPLPLQVKYLIEGEEEIGSPSLDDFIEQHADRLACDVVVISDTCQFAPGRPAITYGLRGIVYYELRLSGPKQDLHSGTFGGAVVNPANTIARILAALVDDNGRVQIPGFYDDVQTLSENEREQISSLPFDENRFMEGIGVTALGGESGYTTLERRWTRPTYDVNGIWGGYQAEGAKTVLPARAGAKFSFRLVPDQDPKKISDALKARIEELCPAGIEWELSETHGAPGVVVPLDSPYMTAAVHAIEHGFGNSPVFIREGGSIPVVSTFHDRLGVDTLLLGWGRDDDNTHSPNEKFNLADFHRGIRASARLWQELARIPAAS